MLDLTRYSHGQMLSRTSAGHALAASASIMLTALAAVFILRGPTLEGITFARLGPGSIAIGAAYFVCIRIIYFAQKESADKPADGGEEPILPFVGKLGLKGAIIGYIVAGAAILVAAPLPPARSSAG